MNYLDCKGLKRDIARQRLKVAELRESRVRISPDLSGMPRCQQTGSKIELTVEALMMEQLRLEGMEHRLTAMIDSIPDGFMQEIFMLRVLKNKTWVWISLHISGHNSADSVRKMCYRYRW